MKFILPILPKEVYFIDLQRFPLGNMPQNPSYLSYPSYLSFFVHFFTKNRVDKTIIMSTPHTPCTKRKSSEKAGVSGKFIAEGKMVFCMLPIGNVLRVKDKKAVR